MSDNKIERVVLYSVLFTLILVLYILISGIINSNFGFVLAVGFESSFWGPASTFLGALLGAGITGLLALRINQKESQRIQNFEIEQSNKVLRILNHYYKNIFEEYESILAAQNSYDAIADPIQEVPIVEVGEGVYAPQYYPQEELDAYDRLTKPLIEAKRKSAHKLVEEYRKFREINTDKLNLDQLDKYLELMSQFKLFVLPVIYEVKEQRHYRIKDYEKVKIDSIFLDLYELTTI